MEHKKSSGERRKHPRYFPEENSQPEVRFIFEDDQKISLEVVNISRGGMLASTTQMEYFLETDRQKIKMIEIMPPEKQPFRCAGKLLRLHPLREDNVCYCAVEFVKLDEENIQHEPSQIEDVKPVDDELTQPDDILQNLMTRIGEAQNYLEIKNHEKAAEVRKFVYDSFSDVTDFLEVEDRWWFFELLDEIKKREPEIPELLKQDFFNLCKKGLLKSSSHNLTPKLGVIPKKS